MYIRELLKKLNIKEIEVLKNINKMTLNLQNSKLIRRRKMEKDAKQRFEDFLEEYIPKNKFFEEMIIEYDRKLDDLAIQWEEEVELFLEEYDEEELYEMMYKAMEKY